MEKIIEKRRNQAQNEEYMINQIIEEFDFDTCRRVMTFLNWRWGGDQYSPSIEQLKKTSVSLLKCVIDVAKKGKNRHETYFASTGGLKAIGWVNKYRQIEGLELEFILTEWDSDGDY